MLQYVQHASRNCFAVELDTVELDVYKCRNLMKNFESEINKWIIKNKLTTHIHVHVATSTKVNVQCKSYFNFISTTVNELHYRSQEIVEGAVYM